MAITFAVASASNDDCNCDSKVGYYNKYGKKLDTMSRSDIPLTLMKQSFPDAYCGMDTTFTKESASITAKYKVSCK